MIFASRLPRRLTAAVLVLLGAVCPVQLPAGQTVAAPGAEWIWSEAQGVGDAAFLKRFVAPKGAARAQLRAVNDFCSVTIYLNGTRIARLDDDNVAIHQDVSRWIRDDENVLSVRAHSPGGPAAIAIRLEWDQTDEAGFGLATDGSWQVCAIPPDGWLEPTFQPGAAWASATSFGAVEQDRWNSDGSRAAITETDNYEQWTQALGADASTDPSSFLVQDGFEIELLRSARPGEGSWISLTFDPRGRIIVGREDAGLLRLTIDGTGDIAVETVNETLPECRGLLWAHGSLYAQANNSKALYRLRDTDGNDRFDEITKLYESSGGVGHGRNGLAVGPDDKLYAIFGDSVDLPQGLSNRTSPFGEHRQGRRTREGHLLRFAPDGIQGEIVASGMRNPYGIDFNPDGELFTYDADAEYDMGAPWYRPTRVLQLVSGADFGWRGVTGAWPPYYPDHPDNAPPVLDIGKGSPTGVKFGTRSHFPPRYRDALYILDWAYGRIVAVHLRPTGAGHAGTAETFIKGRPLNVTDLAFGPDGAMYVVTGGRKTQSGLYRIRYAGPPLGEPQRTPQQQSRSRYAAERRDLRRRLESFHGRVDPQAVAVAWPHLDSTDEWIRHAARIAIEHQPVETWQERALSESRPTAAVTALMALARSPDETLRPRILSRLNPLPLQELSTAQKLAALHAYRLCLSETGNLDPALLERAAEQLRCLFPDESPAVNQELARLLVLLDGPNNVDRIVGLLRSTTDPRERMHYVFVLRSVRQGWTAADRGIYFEALRELHSHQGGEGMPKFLAQLQADALASLSQEQREQYAKLLEQDESVEPLASEPRPLVRAWTLNDVIGDLGSVGQGRDFERGRRLFSEALCSRCHRVGPEGTAVGPDLTAVGRRFSRRDILESILNPSEVVAEQYRLSKIVTKDGRVIVGQIIPSLDFRSPELQIATDPLRPTQLVVLPKSEIESHITSELSVMPAGLLDTLTRNEVLDLLAWIEAGGDAEHPHFRTSARVPD